jgi:hypothetical protein
VKPAYAREAREKIESGGAGAFSTLLAKDPEQARISGNALTNMLQTLASATMRDALGDGGVGVGRRRLGSCSVIEL